MASSLKFLPAVLTNQLLPRTLAPTWLPNGAGSSATTMTNHAQVVLYAFACFHLVVCLPSSVIKSNAMDTVPIDRSWSFSHLNILKPPLLTGMRPSHVWWFRITQATNDLSGKNSTTSLTTSSCNWLPLRRGAFAWGDTEMGQCSGTEMGSTSK